LKYLADIDTDNYIHHVLYYTRDNNKKNNN